MLKNKILKNQPSQNLGHEPFWHTSMGFCKIVSRKLTVKNDWCINNSHTKGWGPIWSVGHQFPSRWTLAFDILWWLSLLVSVCFGSVKDQFCGTIRPQMGSNTHLWHLKMGLATAWHWKCVLHLQCLDFPTCARLQLVKQKCTCHPYYYPVATRAINVKSNTRK